MISAEELVAVVKVVIIGIIYFLQKSHVLENKDLLTYFATSPAISPAAFSTTSLASSSTSSFNFSAAISVYKDVIATVFAAIAVVCPVVTTSK